MDLCILAVASCFTPCTGMHAIRSKMHIVGHVTLAAVLFSLSASAHLPER